MKNVLIGLIAFVITITAVVYQRMTGPTNPKRVNFELSGKNYDTKLIRSLETEVTLQEAKGDYASLNKTESMRVILNDSPENITMKMHFKRYPSNDTLSSLVAVRDGSFFNFTLPAQPPAGKLTYFLEISDGTNTAIVGKEDNITIRFKNSVPLWVLIPHIFLMFFAMFLGNFTGLLSFTKSLKINKYALITIIMLGIGGLILGPIVQKYAFGAYWTGWPFGEDLTDNKTLLAFVIWVSAWFFNRKESRKYLYIIAAIVMLLVYSIPHSTAGSEYNHQKGEIVTGR